MSSSPRSNGIGSLTNKNKNLQFKALKQYIYFHEENSGCFKVYLHINNGEGRDPVLSISKLK